MAERESRPVSRTAPQAFDPAALSLPPAERAHEFGRGLSATQRRALARRGLASLRQSLPDLVEQLARRCVQQAVEEALPTYWLARAERLEGVGTAWAEEAAKACRRKAWLLATTGMPDDLAAELDEVLDHLAGEVV